MAVLSTGLPLADRYLLIEQLGSGGMAVVWRGFDDLLGRPVAVKVLNAEIAADPAFRAAIYKEARSAARLSHPHITHVYDYGEATLPDGETVSYVVMELLDGQTLDDRLADGPLPWPEAVRVAAEVAEALAAAHRRGIVHRDIAPANVMLTATGAKVLDFGIAALAGGRGDAEGDMMGTPAYVAPERLDDAPAAPAADVYALGATLYEALTGHPPLPAQTWSALVEAYRRDPRVPPLSVPGLPAEVAELCTRCLARDPALRPGSAEVARLLDAAVAPATDRVGRARAAAAALDVIPKPRTGGHRASHTRVATTTIPLGAGRRRSRWPRIALGAGGLALAVALALAVSGVLGHHGGPQGAAAAGGVSTAPSVAPAVPGTSAGTNGHGQVAPGMPSAAAKTPTGAPSAAASPASPLATLNQLLSQIQAGQQSSKIRPDVALDLENIVRNLQHQVSLGMAVNYPQQAADLRNRIVQRAQEQGPPPAMDAQVANALLATVNVLAKF